MAELAAVLMIGGTIFITWLAIYTQILHERKEGKKLEPEI